MWGNMLASLAGRPATQSALAHGVRCMRELMLAIILVGLLVAMTSCSARDTRPMGSISVEAAQELIRKGEVRWVVEPIPGCSTVVLRNGDTYCWEPQEFDLQAWVFEAGLTDKVDGLITE